MSTLTLVLLAAGAYLLLSGTLTGGGSLAPAGGGALLDAVPTTMGPAVDVDRQTTSGAGPLHVRLRGAPLTGWVALYSVPDETAYVDWQYATHEILTFPTAGGTRPSSPLSPSRPSLPPGQYQAWWFASQDASDLIARSATVHVT